MAENRIAKSIKLSKTADTVIEKLREIPRTNRKLSYNSVVEDLVENSPKFKRILKELDKQKSG